MNKWVERAGGWEPEQPVGMPERRKLWGYSMPYRELLDHGISWSEPQRIWALILSLIFNREAAAQAVPVRIFLSDRQDCVVAWVSHPLHLALHDNDVVPVDALRLPVVDGKGTLTKAPYDLAEEERVAIPRRHNGAIHRPDHHHRSVRSVPVASSYGTVLLSGSCSGWISTKYTYRNGMWTNA